MGALVQGTDGNFYGTTLNGGSGLNSSGTVFQVTPAGGFKTLYNFCPQTGCHDGSQPYAGLVRGVDGNFYGSTEIGGNNSNCSDCGTIFSITSGGMLTPLHSFGGTNQGEGDEPLGALIQASDGNFYGTTLFGGAFREGTIFQVTPSGVLTNKYNFCTVGTFPTCADGFQPYAGLVQGSDGNLYGTTTSGGAHSNGTVFEVTTGGNLNTLYSFCTLMNCADGDTPYAGLIQGADGNFYGTTSAGGTSNVFGTVFQITPTGMLTTLHSFAGAPNDGGSPQSGLIKASDGNFYGTTMGGGANFAGTIFKITPGGQPSILYNFCPQSGCADGAEPVAGLIQGSDGKLYGTTMVGGGSSNCSGGCGTVFSLDVGLGGGGPVVTLSPTSLSFGKQGLSTTSIAKTVTLKNTGTATLDINSISISGDFAISGNTCGAMLAAGKTCKVKVTFTPTQVGTRTGTLTFSDNAPDSPQTVALSGVGTSLALTPISWNFGSVTVGQTSSPKSFTLTNETGSTVGSIVISLTGSGASDFKITNTTCGSTLAAHASCSITAVFNPQVKGTLKATLKVSSNGVGSPQTASLKGTGT